MSQGQVESEADDKVRCDACPVTCYIRSGMAGACDRYANRDGKLVRVDPHVLLERTVERGGNSSMALRADSLACSKRVLAPSPDGTCR